MIVVPGRRRMHERSNEERKVDVMHVVEKFVVLAAHPVLGEHPCANQRHPER